MPLILLAATITTQAQVQAPVSPPAWTSEAVLITIGFGVIAVLVGLVGWLGKGKFDGIHQSIEEAVKAIKGFTDKQSECRETLSERFADKDGTSQKFKDLYDRTDRHEKLLERHSVLIGGRRIGDRGED